MNIRYIKNFINGNSVNTGNHWVQIAALDVNRTNELLTDANSNRAFNKTVTSSAAGTSTDRTLAQIVDGDISSTRYYSVGTNSQWIQVDLGMIYDIDAVKIWHFYSDNRIYYFNKLEVSENGTNWYTIQQPTGSIKEKNVGTTYFLINNMLQDDFISSKYITTLRNATIEALRIRNISQTIPVFEEIIKNNDISSIKNNITTNLNITFTQSLTDNLERVEDEDINEIKNKIYDSYNNASCRSSCAQECSSTCSGYCHGGCDNSCGAVCSGTCGETCTHGCGTTCNSSCGSSGCSGTCHGCSGACDGAVALFKRTCSANTCQGSCQNSCNNYCYGACKGGCHRICGSSTCGNLCAGGCGTSCNQLCGLTCSSGCENTCSGTCSTVCSNLTQ